MSQSGRNSKRAGHRIDGSFGLPQIVSMLRLLGSMTGALFVVALLFFIVLPSTEESTVIYLLVLAVNLITAVGSIVGAYFLDKKDQELSEKEEQAALDRARVVKSDGKNKDTTSKNE